MPAGSTTASVQRLDPGGFVIFRTPVTPTSLTAVVLNVTVVNPSGTGFVSVFPFGLSLEEGLQTSLLNFTPGIVRPNMTIQPAGASGEIVVFNASNGSVDIVVDITGEFGCPLGDPRCPPS